MSSKQTDASAVGKNHESNRSTAVDDVDEDFEQLPVVDFKEEILLAVKKHQVVICIGETGSGKTTQIPQFFVDDRSVDNILRDEASKRKNRSLQIAVTQPRRIAAISVAQRVCSERGCQLGDEVGYTVRFDDQSTPGRTVIKYMTDGILVRESLTDPDFSQYGLVILDEAHERSLNTDILFGLLKAACRRRQELRLLITSATIDADKFVAYFDNCPVIRVPGRVFPVDIYHSKTKQVMTATGPSNTSYVNAVVDIVMKIHRKDDEGGHILVFLTGQEEIERCCRLIRSAVAEDVMADREMIILPLYAALSSNAQAKVFKKPSALLPYKSHNNNRKLLRKCVVATNIAETSITVPHVRFVVDCGFVKQKAYDPSRMMESLIVVPTSKIAALQRAGRAGRTAAGQCFRLYSSECFDNMMDETIPEIQRINLANTVLYLKTLGISDVMGFDFLDKPSEEQMLQALAQLHTLHALNDTGHITQLGRQMSAFPLEPNLSRALIAAATTTYDCIDEMVIICAMVSSENIFILPPKSKRAEGQDPTNGSNSGAMSSDRKGGLQFQGNKVFGTKSAQFLNNRINNDDNSQWGRRKEIHTGGRDRFEEGDDVRAELAHSAFRHPAGDHFTLLNIFLAWERAGYSPQWCDHNFINYRSMRTARQIREQLARDTRKLNACGSQENVSSAKAIDKRVVGALTEAFFMNAAQRCANESIYKCMPLEQLEKSYDGAPQVRMVHVHPNSAFSFTQCPEYVIYQELVHSTKLYMKSISKADRKLLNQLQSDWKYIEPWILSGRVPRPQPQQGDSIENVMESGKTETAAAPLKDSTAGMKRTFSESGVSNEETKVVPNAKEKADTSSAVLDARQRYLARKALKR